ncbi:hypothetical protein Har1130_18790 [Haloarcula sp. CBA1130]|uniref:hypothetical protein n=1 Tax=unclassified Haloarcula TaxID=2624677 RepID=UPI00124619B4|nr:MULTISPECIES: hypothetical protein [unclassified Haloarcula]KAA9396673.1 hypothetical protein Har1130_18790 [Haloarcula sp. CBA1130]KAA9397702.1 hypothetical protein Har1129_05470 [Haloarcula sp. CBA1129]
MFPVPPSRLALVFSLVLLGGSLAVFGSVTGIVPDETHEFDIEDGSLVATTGAEQQHVLVEDVRTISQIEISRVDGYYVVRTIDRESNTVDSQTRVRAKQVVTSAKTIGGDIPTTDSAVYAVRRIPARLSSDRAAAIGATPNASLRMAIAPNASAFTVRQHDDTIVFERRESQWSDDRLLVVVTPTESGTQYSVVVNLRTETIESLVQLDHADR